MISRSHLFSLLSTSALLFFITPLVVSAQTGLVPCDTTCGFDDVIKLAQNVIEFLIFKIAAPLGAVMFAYAGFLYVTNRGNEGQVSQAHEIFLYVFWGLVVCLAAWLIVNFILVFLLGDGSTYNLLK